jgi:hypothetical protein
VAGLQAAEHCPERHRVNRRGPRRVTGS